MKRLFCFKVLLVVLFLASQAFADEAPFGFYHNEYVRPTNTLNVRDGAGTSYTSLGFVSAAGDASRVIAGPTYNNGYWWWYIDWIQLGTAGWSAQD